ncbi:13432_t:CDS:2 [Funneliformis caledonium]|uniref:13432_t:CDS:1 n=1 Tax=Funneliformis caledonium TaxID=1117310 RepID=A0A9N8ZUP7_9GLOM|nr:13432_t:CDS:2 [Funneliformis caledonium]
MSDLNVVDFWKEVEYQKKLKNQIDITWTKGMLQSARAITDRIVNAIKITNEIH